MRQLWIFVHLLGTVFWLGGAWASMIVGLRAKKEGLAALGLAVKLQAAIARQVIVPGGVLTVISGLFLTFALYGGPLVAAPSIWLMVMQGTGMLAAVILLAANVPATARLARLDPTKPDQLPAFQALRKRQVIAASIGGTLGMIALLSGALLR